MLDIMSEHQGMFGITPFERHISIVVPACVEYISPVIFMDDKADYLI